MHVADTLFVLQLGALVVYDVSTKHTFKEVFPGVPGKNQWLNALKDNADPSLLAAVMLVENKIDKLDPKVLERPPTYVQDADVKRLLADTMLKHPQPVDDSKPCPGWLHDADPNETRPFRIANSLMYARTSALKNQCELYELNEKSDFVNDLLTRVYKPTLEYEQTVDVKTISQALEALVLRIYARSKDINAGGSKPSGKPFQIHVPEKRDAPNDTCCF